MGKKIFIAIIVVLVIIQFIRPARNISNGANPNDIAAHYTVPQNVQVVLQKACYDCHSNNTSYPWYTNIQPVGWWMQHHVNEGKQHLNFSEFASYNKKRKLKRLKDVSESVTEGWMPLDSYLWVHKEAKLTKEESQAIDSWATALAQQIDKTEQ
ncbi:heme-binding domain-containing protein [Chitinophagaceae bacterium MMS25-I14]